MPRFLMTLRSWRARRRPISVSLHLVLGVGVQGLRGEGFTWSMNQGPYCRPQHIYIPCYWDSKNGYLISETTIFLQNTNVHQLAVNQKFVFFTDIVQDFLFPLHSQVLTFSPRRRRSRGRTRAGIMWPLS